MGATIKMPGYTWVTNSVFQFDILIIRQRISCRVSLKSLRHNSDALEIWRMDYVTRTGLPDSI